MAKKKKMPETYVHYPSTYNLGTEEEPYLAACYKIGYLAEFFNMNVQTLRNWIMDNKIPETPIILPMENNKTIYGVRLYIWHQFEGIHLALLKFGKITNRNKFYFRKFILEEWKKHPLLSQYEESAFVYKPLSKSFYNKK